MIAKYLLSIYRKEEQEEARQARDERLELQNGEWVKTKRVVYRLRGDIKVGANRKEGYDWAYEQEMHRPHSEVYPEWWDKYGRENGRGRPGWDDLGSKGPRDAYRNAMNYRRKGG